MLTAADSEAKKPKLDELAVDARGVKTPPKAELTSMPKPKFEQGGSDSPAWINEKLTKTVSVMADKLEDIASVADQLTERVDKIKMSSPLIKDRRVSPEPLVPRGSLMKQAQHLHASFHLPPPNHPAATCPDSSRRDNVLKLLKKVGAAKEDRARNSSPCLKDQLDHQPEISLRYCDDEACDDAVATGRYKVLQDDLRLDTDSSYEEEVTERTTEVIRKKRGKKM